VRARSILLPTASLVALALVRCGGSAAPAPRVAAPVVPPAAPSAVAVAPPPAPVLIHEEGDACVESKSGSNAACTADSTREVVCRGGKEVLNRHCRGPDKCQVYAGAAHCDDDYAEIGDHCEPNLGDDNYSCSVDRQNEILCDRRSRQFGLYAVCRGPKRCHVDNHTINCDAALGRVGEPCDPVGTFACSEDASSRLQCSEVGTWAKELDCRKSACTIRDNTVYCE